MCSANRKKFLDRKLVLAVFASVGMIFTSMIYAKSITVTCPVSASSPLATPCVSTPASLLNGSTPSLDRCAIQNAINNAKAGDAINISGTCQADGEPMFVTKSNLTIQGGALLKGVPRSSSDPRPHGGPGPFNYGFQVGALDGSVPVKNLTIQGLHFRSFSYPILVVPSLGLTSELFTGISDCNKIITTNNAASNVNIVNNSFDYFNSIESDGLGNNINISNNQFTNSRQFDITIFGAGPIERCPNATYGKQTGIIITGNTSSSNLVPVVGISIYGADKVLIAKNNFSVNTYNGMTVAGNDMLIANNNIDGQGNIADNISTFAATGIIGTLIGDPTADPLTTGNANTLVINNTISNTLPGIWIDSDVSGYVIIANTITGTTYGLPNFGIPNLGDVTFCDNGVNSSIASPGFPCDGGGFNYNFLDAVASHNNVLITPSCQKVLDLGFNNSLTGLISLSTNILTDTFPAQCAFLFNAKD